MANDDQTVVERIQEEVLEFRDNHRFLLLIVLAVVVAIIMTVVSMTIYNFSGAAQLDLSRPGYRSVSDQVETERDTFDYSASGPINKQTVDEFTTLYDEQATKAKGVDAFNGDPLNPEVLEFGTPAAE